MSLEESVDCKGTCSSLSSTGCRLVSHEECENTFNEAIKKLPTEKYVRIMNNLQTKHPLLYKIAKYLKF